MMRMIHIPFSSFSIGSPPLASTMRPKGLSGLAQQLWGSVAHIAHQHSALALNGGRQGGGGKGSKKMKNDESLVVEQKK